jgi:fatty-acyl-CoA synthase
MRQTAVARGAIACRADIENIEAVPLAERDLPASTYQFIRQAAEQHPAAIALRYVSSVPAWISSQDSSCVLELTYAEFLGQIHRCANALHSLGLGPEDVVSMVLPNVPEAHLVLWGGEACAIVNPINYLLEGGEIGAIAHSAGSRVLVIHGEHAELGIWPKLAAILEAAPALEHVLVVGGSGGYSDPRCVDFHGVLGRQRADALDFARDWSDGAIASLFHTGGTTGLPKLAQHSHGNEVYCAWAINSLIPEQADTCYFTGLPLFHCNAAIGSGLSVFGRGGTVLLAGINGFRSPGVIEHFYALIEKFAITNFNAVPTVFSILSQLPCEGFNLSSLQFAVCGAAPMPVSLFEQFQRHTGIRLLEGYGLTEATVCSSLTPLAADPPRIGSIGLPIPYTRMQAVLVDSSGGWERVCHTDEVGTLLINGPSVTPGYTDSALNAGLFLRDPEGQVWLNTGDLAREDADGYFWLTGRAKELIIRGGHNIDPKTIEEALSAHPAVNLVAAIGRPDKYAGELPVAYVDVNSEVSADELLAWCERHIGERAAVPKDVVILAQLPVTGVGKIHKPTLLLREVEHVVQRELAELSELLAQFTVQAEPSKKHGTVVKLALTAQPHAAAEAVESAVRQSLDGYGLHLELVPAGPAALDVRGQPQ